MAQSENRLRQNFTPENGDADELSADSLSEEEAQSPHPRRSWHAAEPKAESHQHCQRRSRCGT